MSLPLSVVLFLPVDPRYDSSLNWPRKARRPINALLRGEKVSTARHPSVDKRERFIRIMPFHCIRHKGSD